MSFWKTLSKMGAVMNPATLATNKGVGLVNKDMGGMLERSPFASGIGGYAAGMAKKEDDAMALGGLEADNVMRDAEMKAYQAEGPASVYGEKSPGGLNSALGGSIWGKMASKTKGAI